MTVWGRGDLLRPDTGFGQKENDLVPVWGRERPGPGSDLGGPGGGAGWGGGTRAPFLMKPGGDALLGAGSLGPGPGARPMDPRPAQSRGCGVPALLSNPSSAHARRRSPADRQRRTAHVRCFPASSQRAFGASSVRGPTAGEGAIKGVRAELLVLRNDPGSPARGRWGAVCCALLVPLGQQNRCEAPQACPRIPLCPARPPQHRGPGRL